MQKSTKTFTTTINTYQQLRIEFFWWRWDLSEKSFLIRKKKQQTKKIYELMSSPDKESDETVVDDAAADNDFDYRLLQGIELIKKQEWENGRTVFNDLLSVTGTHPTELHNNVICTALVGQLLCLLHLKRYDELVKTSRNLLSLKPAETLSHTQSIAHYALIYGLVEQQRSSKDVAAEISTWLKACSDDDSAHASEWLKEIQSKLAGGAGGDNSIAEEQFKPLRDWIDKQPTDACTKNLPKLSVVVAPVKEMKTAAATSGSRKNSDVDNVSSKNGANDTSSKVINSPTSKSSDDGGGSVSCTYCSLHFNDRSELRAHCQTDEHQKILMSDEGKRFTSPKSTFSN